MKVQETIAVLAVAVLAMACAKTELEMPEKTGAGASDGKGVIMSVIPALNDMKTSLVDNLDGTFTPMWDAGDAISMSFCASDDAGFRDFNKKLASQNGSRADKTTFSGIIYAPTKSGNYDFYAVYPQTSVLDGSTPKGILVDLPQSQIVPAGSFDPKADILFGEKKTIAVSNTSKDLQKVEIRFARIEALARIAVDADKSLAATGLDEAVLGVSLSNSAGIDFAGRLSVNPSNPDEMTVVGNGTTSIEAAPAGSVTLRNLDMMLALAPCSLKAGDKLTITIRTETKLLSKEVTLAQATEFQANSVKMLTCRIDDKWSVSNVPVFNGGSGTSADPYLITYPADLMMLSTLTNGASASQYTSKCYVQTADINMDKAGNYKPACCSAAFSGSYDGQGHTISNLHVKGIAGTPSGMFANLSGAKISNLKIKDITVSAVAPKVGSIAGASAASAVVQNCGLEGELICDQQYLGGLIGYCATTTVNNCTVNGTVQNLYLSTRYSGATDNGIAGGFCGQYCQNSRSEGCTMNGRVYSTASYSGGFAGYMTTSIVKGFHLTKGSEVSSDENTIGGVAGYQGGSSNATMTNNRIDDCIVEGTVGGRGNQVGGITGRSIAGEIKGCLVSSSCKVSTYKRGAGGIIGYCNPTQYPVRITNCTTYCDVSAYSDVGGITGYAQAGNASTSCAITITNCAHIGGELFATKYYDNGGKLQGRVAGIVGCLYGAAYDGSSVTIANCYSRPKHVATELKAKYPCSAGLAGAMGRRYTIQNCYTDVTSANMFFGWKTLDAINPATAFTKPAYGALFGWYDSYQSSDKIALKGLYYIGTLPSGPDADLFTGAGVMSGCSTFTAATAGDDLAGRLNAGADTYNASSPAVKAANWVVGQDGFATLSTVLGDPNVAKKNPLRVSVIGDSISTFRGYIPNGYGAHYPTSDGALDFVQQTYWWKLINEYMSNAVLDKNISNSGTTVAKRDETFEYSASGGHCFIYRYTNEGIGRPDIVIVAGGSNDWTHVKDMGDGIACKNATQAPPESYLNSLYSQSTLAVSDSTKFCPAYVHLLRCITTDHPKAKIVCIIGDRESTGQQDAIHKMAAHYGARVIDLLAVNGFNESTFMPKHDAASGGVHPGAEGHAFIANKIYAELGPWLEGQAE